MFILADVPTSGLYVGWGFGIIAMACVIFGLIFLGTGFTEDRYSRRTSWTIGATSLACGVVIGVTTLWSMWPLKYEYHHYVTKEGKVTKIASRFVPTGSEGGVQQRFVFVINGFPYGVDDTRAALVKEGDHVAIKCKKEHQFFQQYNADGWACRWGA